MKYGNYLVKATTKIVRQISRMALQIIWILEHFEASGQMNEAGNKAEGRR